MRITNSMMVTKFMGNLSLNTQRMDSVNEQMTTGRTWVHGSNDPTSMAYSERSRFALRELKCHKKAIDSAESWLTQAESSIMNINDLLKRAYEDCIDASTNIKHPDDRKILSGLIGQFRDELLSLLNSTSGGRYVFGGYNTTGSKGPDGTPVPPFTTKTYSVTYDKQTGFEHNIGDKVLDANGQFIKYPDPAFPASPHTVNVKEGDPMLYTETVYEYEYEVKKDANGDPITDGDGNPEYILDDSGNRIPARDGNGDPLYATDENGDKIPVHYVGDNILNNDGKPTYYAVDGTVTYTYQNGDFLFYTENEDPITVQITEDRQQLYMNGLPVPPLVSNQVMTDAGFTNPADYYARVDALRKDNIAFQIASGTKMDVTYNGMNLLFYVKDPTNLDGSPSFDDNIFSMMDQFSCILRDENTTVAEVQEYISKLQSSQKHILNNVTEIGGKSVRLDLLKNRYVLDEENLGEMISNAEDAEYEVLTMEFNMAFAIYKAALSVGSYIVQPTLMDYLR